MSEFDRRSFMFRFTIFFSLVSWLLTFERFDPAIESRCYHRRRLSFEHRVIRVAGFPSGTRQAEAALKWLDAARRNKKSMPMCDCGAEGVLLAFCSRESWLQSL